MRLFGSCISTRVAGSLGFFAGMLLAASVDGQQQPAGPRPQFTVPQSANGQTQGVAAQSAPQVHAPQPPFKLTPAEEKKLDELLGYWERRSSGVKTYDCDFKRYNYDSVFGPPNPRWHKTQSEGIIRFGAPDKGEFHVERVGHFQPPTDEGAEPTYPMSKTDEAEHWISDGTSIYELDAERKAADPTCFAPRTSRKTDFRRSLAVHVWSNEREDQTEILDSRVDATTKS